MNNRIDEYEIQRILDGRVEPEELELIVQLSDETPENWRSIAMAFIEEQTLRNQLHKMTDADAAEPGLVRSSQQKASVRQSSWIGARTIAVCCLMGIALWIGRASVTPQPIQANSSDAEESYTILLTPEVQPANMVANHLQVADPDLQSADLNVTGFDSDELMEMFTPLFDQQSQGFFQENGYTVREEPVIYVVRGEQGERFVVPRRNVSFVANR